MSEKLLYIIQQGPNKVGRADAAFDQNIVIGGLGVLQEHCIITRSTEPCSVVQLSDDGTEASPLVAKEILTVVGVDMARICINGVAITPGEEARLAHSDRLILGNSNVFRVVIPSARPPDASAGDIARESQIDWQLAMRELNNTQLQANLEIEAQVEREKQAMDAKVKEMEALWVSR
jgi:hypothetical protein